jgi:hypothetical protein
MCPPFEIVGKKQLIVTKRGYFEILQNRIQYKITNHITDFLVLSPEEGIGMMTELPLYSNIDAFKLFHNLAGELGIEICFSLSGKKKDDLLLDFIFSETLPFSMKQYDSGFFQLKILPDSIYEEFYRQSMTIEETMTTTISTFDDNVFLPFKKRFIASIHNRVEEEAKKTISTFSRDFPRFFKLHKDLLTILLTQAKQVSDHQHLSFSIFAPILRKVRMLNTMRKYFEIKGRKKRIELNITPLSLNSTQIAEKMSLYVELK